ncbi:hypothetical protein ACL9RI_27395, partial [Janthinobacterium sp. Mn2066]|uniref:hypothetical protein n=1 Tax=Janthinobacterium sp. Mn2066 TaxID=3395264 RepID=UPI003BDD1F78
DSAATSVKVGYCQACYSKKPLPVIRSGFFLRLLVLQVTRQNIIKEQRCALLFYDVGWYVEIFRNHLSILLVT